LVERESLSVLRCSDIRRHGQETVALNLQVPIRSIRGVCEEESTVTPWTDGPEHRVICEAYIAHLSDTNISIVTIGVSRKEPPYSRNGVSRCRLIRANTGTHVAILP
jgi:hypothetical protein